MSKFRREIERVRTKLDRLQQDPTQTPSTSIIGVRPHKLQDYHNKDQGRIQVGHENDTCIDPYPAIGQQIQVDAILSRQLHEEEHIQFR